MNKKLKDSYDVAVIGAGSAGLTAAVGFSRIGKSVLLIENQHMGGECTNSGCIPSKSLLHFAKQYRQAISLSGESDATEQFKSSVMDSVHQTIQSILDEEQPEHFEKMGINVVMGESEFTSPSSITINDQEISFKKCVIATGSAPRMIDIPGLDKSDLLTNQNLFELKEIPEKLLIIGGGPIGVEMGQAFAMLGTTVTIVTNEETFLSREESESAKILQKVLEKLGVTIFTSSTVKECANSMAIVENKNGNKQSISYEKILLAIGRVPVFPTGLDVANVSYSKHGIEINGNYRTTNKNIFASGDVALRDKFTHTADNASRDIVAGSILPFGLARLLPKKKKSVPKVTYTDPEIASVGLNSKNAVQHHNPDSLRIITVPYSQNDRAKTDEKTKIGSITVVAKKLTGRVIGASITGPSAGEIISIFTLAIDNKLSMYKLGRLIYPYPTYSLIIKKVADTYLAETIANIQPDLVGLLQRNLKKIVGLLLWLTVIGLFFWYKDTSGLTYREMVISLFNAAVSTWYGPILYILAYAIRPLLFFPATLMTILSGTVFGLWFGLLYTLIGANLSASVAYFTGLFFGKDIKTENGLFSYLKKGIDENTFTAILFARLAYFPYDLTNYAAGILQIKWVPFTLATVIGIIPGTLSFVAIGASIENIEQFNLSEISIDWQTGLFAAFLFIVSLTLSKYFKKRSKKLTK